MPLEDHELFPDEFMNDMLLNPEAYGMEDGLREQEYKNDESEEE